MSEKILKALLQLFAIIAKGDAVGEGARPDNAAPSGAVPPQAVQS
jgi:hypothetical protein